MKYKIPETISVPVWWNTGGGGLINRECLESDHPESRYSYIKNVLGLNPEDYGCYSDDSRRNLELWDMTKPQLIQRCIYLEKEIKALEEAGFI